MEVNIFGEGAVGYKNIVKSSSSQDFFLYKKYKNYAVCTVADGHSMDVFKYSHIGSYLACQSVFEILNRKSNTKNLLFPKVPCVVSLYT